MENEFETGKLSINELFKFWFVIPEFQRHYVWNEEQVFNLLSDIQSAYETNKESEYFLGMIVLNTIDKKEHEFNVLDGQQRILTLLLIFAVIRELAEERCLQEACANKIFRGANQYEQTDQKIRVRFAIRNKVQTYIEDYIVAEGKILNTISSEVLTDTSIINLCQAISVVHKELMKLDDLSAFAKYLLQKVAVIYVASTNIDNAFQMFTVLNNRGVKLNSGEILKAMNLAVINDGVERQKYAELWEDAEAYFEKNFDTFLLYIRNIIKKDKITRSLVKEFELIYEMDEEAPLHKGKETFDCILSYKDCYERLFEEENYRHLEDYTICNLLHLMQEFASDYWIAPLLAYYKQFRTEHLKEFLVCLERKFAADWIIGDSIGKRTDEMNRLIRIIEQENDSQNIINHFIFSYDSEKLRLSLDSPIYGRTCTRYLLLKLDMIYHGNQTKYDIPSVVSIEHILPRTPGVTSQWVRDYTLEEMDEWTNKLGNLMLISRHKNSSLNNNDYVIKREKYFKANIELFSNSIRIYQNYPTWTVDDLQRNHQEVMGKLCEAFKLNDVYELNYSGKDDSCPNAYKPWYVSEEITLVDLYKKGKSIADIAIRLGRSQGGIYSRLEKLGYELD